MSSYPKGVRSQPPQAAVPPVAARDPTKDLLLWKNPIETGKYFGLSLLVLLILKKVNLITFFLRVLYTVIFTTGAIEFASKVVLGQGLVSKYGPNQCPNVAGCLRPRIDDLLKQLPVYQCKVRTLIFSEEPKQNFKAGVVLYFLHKFFSWFSVWTIVFLGVISAFTLPLVYYTHQEEIDSAVNHGLKVARAKSAEFSQIASEKSKPYLEKLDQKLGPVSKFIKTQYANANRASAGAQTTSSAAPQATTADLAGKVPVEPTPSEGAYVSGHAPAATSAASRGVSSAQTKVDEAAAHAKAASAGPSGTHHLSDLSEGYSGHFGHDFSVPGVQEAATKAFEKTGHKFPEVPTSNPLSGEAEHDFSVDQLQNELRQNKDTLTQELNFNKH